MSYHGNREKHSAEYNTAVAFAGRKNEKECETIKHLPDMHTQQSKPSYTESKR